MLNLYADSVNKQFEKSSSHYVDFKTRLRQRINGETFLHSILENTTESFKEKNPHLKSWADLKLCRADSCALGDIRIDITMQRMVLFMWLIKILNEFEEIKLNPLRVFEDPDNPGKFVCWDGQHTGLALYVIATMVLGEDPDNCEIPINVYPIEHKAEARKNFMYANGEGSWDLDAIDFFQQMIFGVRTDGTKLPSWLVAEEKQQHLERAKMFATSDKFGDSDEPGAQPRMQELMDNSFSPTVTKHFCKYFTLICHSSRPVQPKESWMLYEYFRLCEADSRINVDNNYIQSVVRALRVVGGNDFDSLDFWHRAKTSYQNYYQQNVRHGLDLLGIRYPERPLAITFLIAQIRKAGVSVPNYRETYYEVPEGDLF
jgi:hypothetical protein